MKLVEPAIYSIINTANTNNPSLSIPRVHIGVVPSLAPFPLVIVRRLFTDVQHLKSFPSAIETVQIQISSCTSESILQANTIATQIESILEVVHRASVAGHLVHTIQKQNEEYFYDEEMKVHMVHTDYNVTIE